MVGNRSSSGNGSSHGGNGSSGINRSSFRLARNEGLVLLAALVGQSWGILKLPSGDISLVKLVKLPVGSAVSLGGVNTSWIEDIYATYLRIVQPKENCRGN